MENTLFHESITDREWGANLIAVAALEQWVSEAGLILKTIPSLDNFDFVQAEALLCAIERYATQCTPAEALSAIRNDKTLKEHRVYKESPEDPMPSHVWLYASEAPRQWRELIRNGLHTGDLALLNPASKLPLKPATYNSNHARHSIVPTATKQEIAAAFKLVEPKWDGILKNPNREGKRYIPALVSKGTRGRSVGGGTNQTLWNPVIFARLLVESDNFDASKVKALFKRSWPQWEDELLGEIEEIARA